MSRYEILLFLHIAFVIVWLGAGFLFHLLGYRAERADDRPGMEKITADLVATANTVFIPSSLLVLVFGILLTIDGPWSFGDLWIVLGLVGFAVTFLTGVLWIKPQSERTHSLVQRDGGMGPEAFAVARRMMIFARLDYVVLFLVVLDMTVKPTADDVGTLALMAAILVGGAAYFAWRARRSTFPRPPRPASALRRTKGRPYGGPSVSSRRSRARPR
jgi:uncharacterized membrane protein